MMASADGHAGTDVPIGLALGAVRGAVDVQGAGFDLLLHAASATASDAGDPWAFDGMAATSASATASDTAVPLASAHFATLAVVENQPIAKAGTRGGHGARAPFSKDEELAAQDLAILATTATTAMEVEGAYGPPVLSSGGARVANHPLTQPSGRSRKGEGENLVENHGGNPNGLLPVPAAWWKQVLPWDKGPAPTCKGWDAASAHTAASGFKPREVDRGKLGGPLPASQDRAPLPAEKRKGLEGALASAEPSGKRAVVTDTCQPCNPEMEVMKDKDRGLLRCSAPGCGKTFTFPFYLARHMRTHNGERPFKCEFRGCGKSFTRKEGLVEHERTHTGERPYHCPYALCGKAFAQSSTLANHVRTHKGERPFVCTYEKCAKAFADRGGLASHLRTHRGEKPYTCTFPGCNKSFAQPSGLKRHQGVHDDSNEAQFPCPVPGCGKTYKHRDGVNQHLRLKHRRE